MPVMEIGRIHRVKVPSDPSRQLAVPVHVEGLRYDEFDFKVLQETALYGFPMLRFGDVTITDITFSDVWRLTIKNADGTRQVTSFDSTDIFAASTPSRDFRLDRITIVPEPSMLVLAPLVMTTAAGISRAGRRHWL